MDGFNEWLGLLNNFMKCANHATNLLGKFTTNPDPEKQAYRQRVRTRRRNKEERPEWDHIGRCIWHFNQNVPNIIRMEYVPQDVQDAFSASCTDAQHLARARHSPRSRATSITPT